MSYWKRFALTYPIRTRVILTSLVAYLHFSIAPAGGKRNKILKFILWVYAF